MRYAILGQIMAAAFIGWACAGPTAPGLGLDAGPGSPECRRAINNITHPGDLVNEPGYNAYVNEVLKKCVSGVGAGDELEEPKEDGDPT